MEKNALRKHMLTLLNKMSPSQYNTLSNQITDRFIDSDDFQHAHTIGLTISRFPEVNTAKLIESSWAAGKKIAVPKTNLTDRSMDFRYITSFDQLEKVQMGLFEPMTDVTVSVPSSEIDLQIVPGVLFSEKGYRIGFGGGYYDRYLAAYCGKIIALAFSRQTGHSIPVESHDLPVQKIYTESEVIDC